MSIFTIIPVHNRLKFTKKCLLSLKKQNYKNLETILIDDGSTDSTFEFVRKNYPNIHIIKGDGSLWWTKAVQLGIDYALPASKSSDYIYFLNNDCFLTDKNYFSKIIATARKYPNSIVGSINVRSDKPSVVVEAGVRIHWETGLVYSVAEKISTELSYYKNMKIIDQLDALPGKGTLIPIEVFSKIDGLNYKMLPHYIADYEFFNRAKRSGFELIIDTSAIAKHDWEATGLKHNKNRLMTWRRAWVFLFGRKSMTNIIDWLRFIKLACPPEYKALNYYITFWRMVGGLTRMFPFTLLKPFIPRITFLLATAYNIQKKMRLKLNKKVKK